jgi:TolB-like protein/Flp pilus assembly protein TadD
MTIWEGEIKELDKLYESFKGFLPDIVKELEQLIKTRDPNVVMLYSRRCLEVIVTDLCECELKRPRKTEPLKGIIDKLNSEEKIPSHIISSMLSLNSMSVYGTHPKDFDPEQVKPVLNNLAIIIRWYIKYKDFKIVNKTSGEEEKCESKALNDSTKTSGKPKKRLILYLSGVFLVVVIIAFTVINFFGSGNRNRSKNFVKLEKTIAVLPFRNLSNDTTQAYFCDGFMEEILNNLQKVSEFTVRSRADQYRNTTKSVKTIGEEMNVNYLISGSIDKEGDNLIVWIKLIESSTDKLIWSNEYLREIKQVFSLRSEIAKMIASELKTALSPQEIIQIEKKSTENLEAYNYYLLGNDYSLKGYNVENFEIAANMFGKAIELDPDFALAYVKLSLCHLRLFWLNFDHTSERLAMSKEAIDKAFKLDPDLPDAHLALSSYYYMGFLNYSKAMEEVKIAEKLSKNNTEYFSNKANIYRRSGEWAIAKENYIKALELDPGSPITVYDFALTLYFMNEYQESEKYYNKTILLNPVFTEAIWQKTLMYLKWKGNTKQARETISEAFHFKENVNDPILIQCNVIFDLYDGHFQEAISYLSSKEIDIIEHHLFYNLKSLLYARVYNLMNNSEKAYAYFDSARIDLESKILKNPDDSRLYSALGIAYAGLGLKVKALEAGKKAVKLMPINKDALRGAYRAEDLARIYVMVGDYDAALDLIKQLLKTPSNLSVKLLLLDPTWKPLWNLPEFKELVKIYTQK